MENIQSQKIFITLCNWKILCSIKYALFENNIYRKKTKVFFFQISFESCFIFILLTVEDPHYFIFLQS